MDIQSAFDVALQLQPAGEAVTETAPVLARLFSAALAGLMENAQVAASWNTVNVWSAIDSVPERAVRVELAATL